ncbi:unnamed protein product [Oikopleura dioica]|uniref:Phospholipase A2-like central domain-containing protein n=1 Tax=Oikopleura dioica TaxID=34765 RepID=E4X8H6_OIKDI|nr:unnamed protein product [Oikopleura dioica]
MKLFGFFAISARVAQATQSERLATLLEMIKHYRPNFEDTKYFSYGCHCLIRGDQLDHHGTGQPVDALDSVCRKYKNCQKCVQFEYGKTCTEEAAYKIRYSSSGAIRARDRLATCEREVFNCDHQFAIELAEELDVYDQGFHTFMGPFDYNDPANCSKIQSRTIFKAECCGGVKSAFTLFNSFGIQKCCPDGSVRNEC